MTFKAEIPETINYDAATKIHKIKFGWRGVDEKYNNDFHPHFQDLQCCHANVLVPSSKNANRKSVVVLPNEPMEGLRFVGMSYSKMGSDSIRVRLPNQFVVDISLSAFMETLLNEGVKPGGILPGKWIWAKIPGGMTLVRVGTGYHQAIQDYLKREAKPKCQIRKLNVGRVYADPEKNCSIFLGFINTYTMSIRVHPEDKDLISYRNNRNHWGWKEKKKSIRYDVEFKHVKLATLWFDTWRNIAEIKNQRNKIIEDLKSNSRYKIKAIKKHNFVEELDIKEFPVPDEIIINEANYTKRNLEKNIIRWTANEMGNNKYNSGYGYGSVTFNHKIDINSCKPSYHTACEVRSGVMKSCMVPFPVEPILPDLFELFKPFHKDKNSELSKAINLAKEAKKNKN